MTRSAEESGLSKKNYISLWLTPTLPLGQLCYPLLLNPNYIALLVLIRLFFDQTEFINENVSLFCGQFVATFATIVTNFWFAIFLSQINRNIDTNCENESNIYFVDSDTTFGDFYQI